MKPTPSRLAGFCVAAVATLLLASCASSTADGEASAKKPAAGGDADGTVVATIGDRSITLAEADARAREMNMQAYQALYEARSQAIDEMVAKELLERAAEQRGVTSEELLEQVVSERSSEVTDADVETFYQQNQNQMGGRSLDQVREQVLSFLANQRKTAAAQAYIEELKAGAGVEVMLSPPRIELDVAEGEPVKGPAGAPIEIVEYSEYQCPYCSRVGPTIEQVMDRYGDKVRLVFRDFPLPMHQQAPKASEAAHCAGAQGEYWEYHDTLFANQQQLGVESLKKYAADLGLDTERFNQCLDSGEYSDAVQQNVARGRELGVTGTPAFFINGRFLSGAQPFETFVEIIDEELKRQGIEPPARG